MNPTVLITDYVWPSIDVEKRILKEINANILVAPKDDEPTLIKMATNAEAILTCFAKVTENVILSAKKCKVISRYGVGVDNINVDTATKEKIIVTYVPDYCIHEVSDHVIAMMLTWNRKILKHHNQTISQGWSSVSLNDRIMRLNDKLLGIIGYGRIGRAVASKASAFGLNILVYDPFISEQTQDSSVSFVTLEKLLEKCHFVTLHAPLLDSTKNLMDEDQFSLMRADAFLINAARGGLINEQALYSAITSKKIAGAGLDVLIDIDPPLDHRIINLENVIITPHSAFFSQESVVELEERAAKEVVRVLKGEMPENIINPSIINNSRANLNTLN